MLLLPKYSSHARQLIHHHKRNSLPNQKSLFIVLREFDAFIKLQEKNNVLGYCNKQGILSRLKQYKLKIQDFFSVGFEKNQSDDLVVFYTSLVNNISYDTNQIQTLMKKLNEKFHLYERSDNFGFIMGKLIESKIRIKQEYKKGKISKVIQKIILVTKIDRLLTDFSKYLTQVLLQMTYDFILYNYQEGFQKLKINSYENKLKQFFTKKEIYLNELYKTFKINQHEIMMTLDRLTNFKSNTQTQRLNSLIAIWFFIKFLFNYDYEKIIISNALIATIQNVISKLFFILYQSNLSNFKLIISIAEVTLNEKTFQKLKVCFFMHLCTLIQLEVDQFQIIDEQKDDFRQYLQHLFQKYIGSIKQGINHCSDLISKTQQFSQFIKFLSQKDANSLSQLSEFKQDQNDSANRLNKKIQKLTSKTNKLSIGKSYEPFLKHYNSFKSTLTEQFLKCLDQYKYHQILIGLDLLRKKFIEQRDIVQQNFDPYKKSHTIQEIQTLYATILFKVLFEISKPSNFLIQQQIFAKTLIKSLQKKILQYLILTSKTEVDFDKLYESLYYDQMNSKMLKFNLFEQDYGIRRIFDYCQKKIFTQTPGKIYVILKLKTIYKSSNNFEQDQTFMNRIQECNTNRNYISLKIQQFFDNYLKFYPIKKNQLKFMKIFKCLINIIDKENILIDIFANVVYHSLKGVQSLQIQTCKMLKMLYQILFISKMKKVVISNQTSKTIFLFYQKLKKLDLQKDQQIILNANYLSSSLPYNVLANQPMKTKFNSNQEQDIKPINLFFNLFLIDNQNHQEILNFGLYFFQIQKYYECIFVLQRLGYILQQQQILKPQQAEKKKQVKLHYRKQIQKYLLQSYSKLDKNFQQHKNHIKQKCFIKQDAYQNQNYYFEKNYKIIWDDLEIKRKNEQQSYQQESFLKQMIQVITKFQNRYFIQSKNVAMIQGGISLMNILLNYCQQQHEINNSQKLKNFYNHLIAGQLIFMIFVKVNDRQRFEMDNQQLQQNIDDVKRNAKTLISYLPQIQLSNSQEIIQYLQIVQIQNKTYDCSLIKKFYDSLIQNKQFDKLTTYINNLYGHFKLQQMQILQLEALLKYNFHKKYYQKVILIKQYITDKLNNEPQIQSVDPRYTDNLRHILNLADIYNMNLIAEIQSIPTYSLRDFQKTFSQILNVETQINVNGQIVKMKKYQNSIELNDLKNKRPKFYEEMINLITMKVSNYFKLFRVIFDRVNMSLDKRLSFFNYLQQFYNVFQIKLLSKKIKSQFFFYYLMFLFEKINSEFFIKNLEIKQKISKFLSTNVKYLKTHSVYVIKNLQDDPKSAKNQLVKTILAMIIKDNPASSCWILSFLYYFDYKKPIDANSERQYYENINKSCNNAFVELSNQILAETKIQYLDQYRLLAGILIDWIDQAAQVDKPYRYFTQQRCNKQIKRFNDALNTLKFKVPLVCNDNLFIRKISAFSIMSTGKSSPFKIQFICERIDDEGSQKKQSESTMVRKVFVLKYNYSTRCHYRMQADSANFYKQIGVLDPQVTYNIFNLTKYVILVQCIQNCDSLMRFIISSNKQNEKKFINIRKWKQEYQQNRIKANRSTYITDFLDNQPQFKISIFQSFYFDNLSHDYDFIRWWTRLNNYIRTLAYWSYLCYITKLGDRHKQNILINTFTGKLAHIDLQFNFGFGLKLGVKQLVPFRLNQLLLGPVGFFKQNGLFYTYFKQAIQKFQSNEEAVWKALGYFSHDKRKSIIQSACLRKRFDSVEQGIEKIIELALDKDLLRQMYCGWQPQI